MAEQVHLLLHADDNESIALASWLHVANGTATSALKNGTLTEAAADIGDAMLVVYIPSRDIMLTRIELPEGRRSQLRNALPYALEDNLIDDIETLHCALGEPIDSTTYNVAVVSKSSMQHWQTLLQDAGLHAKVMLPDTLLLPWQETEWSLHCEDRIVRVRSGAAQGFVCDILALPSMLQLALGNSAQPGPERLRILGCDNLDTEGLTLPGDIEIIREEFAGDTAGLLLTAGTSEAAINLLQGPYAPARRVQQQLRPWYAAAALALILLLLGLGNNVLEYVSLSRQSTELQAQMNRVYQFAFPGAKPVSNPYQRMQSELKKAQGGGEERLFREMLAQIAPVAKNVGNVRVMNLRYHEGEMELLVELPDLESLEALRQQLINNTPWEVTLKSANASENKVLGRLLIAKTS